MIYLVLLIVVAAASSSTAIAIRATTSHVNFRMEVRPSSAGDAPDEDDARDSSTPQGDGSNRFLRLRHPPSSRSLATTEGSPSSGWSTTLLFEFESAAAKLFHERMAATFFDEDEKSEQPDAMASTSVHVRDISQTFFEGKPASLLVDSSVAVTYLRRVVDSQEAEAEQQEEEGTEAGIKAVSEAVTKMMEATDVASALSASVSSADIMGVLEQVGLLPTEGDGGAAGVDGLVVEVTFTNGGEDETAGGVMARDADGVYDTDVVLSTMANREEEGGSSTSELKALSALNETTRNGGGWPMFMAGAAMTLLLVFIVAVALWVFKKERYHLGKDNDDKSHNNGDETSEKRYEGTVHDDHHDYNGDDGAGYDDAATTASGVLGLKGYHPHPREVNNENVSPNMSPNSSRRFLNRRKSAAASRGIGPTSGQRSSSRGGAGTLSGGDEEAASSTLGSLPNGRLGMEGYDGHHESGPPTCDDSNALLTTPNMSATHQSQVSSASSRHPLGITSIRKLNRFLTPTPQKEGRSMKGFSDTLPRSLEGDGFANMDYRKEMKAYEIDRMA